jgi:hypothetical protein
MRTPQRSFEAAFANVAVLTLLAMQCTSNATSTNNAAITFGTQPPFIEPAAPQSSFTQPKRREEGRDPFFPKSIRPYGEESKQKNVPPVTPIAELALKGISGTPEQPLAIINTTTFAAGEEGDVLTRAGKIRIRCVEIRMSEGTVLVQVGGQSRELRLAK